ncbi:dynein light chain [Fagus crenata]
MKPPSSDVWEPSSAAVATPPSGKVIVKSADMLPKIQKEAVNTAISSCRAYKERVRCIVGKNFGNTSQSIFHTFSFLGFCFGSDLALMVYGFLFWWERHLIGCEAFGTNPFRMG